MTTSAALCVRGAARRLAERDGRIVLVAAAAAKPGFADTALNVLAKRAVDGLHEGMLRELRGTRCLLTTIYPDAINSAGSAAVEAGDAMSYGDVASTILFAMTVAPTMHVQEIVVTARNTGR